MEEFDRSSLYYVDSTPEGTRYSLYDTASWKNGLAFKNIDFSETGLPVIKIAELNNGISSSTAYTDKTYSQDVFLTKGDYVFSWSGNPETSIDIYKYNLSDGWLNQHIFKVTPKTEIIDKGFFFYLMKFLKPYFKKIATNKQTTGLGHVTISDLQRMSVALPPLPTQQKIAALLSSLDDKIELNNKINTNLEQQAQALFKNWFVDFEPFGGKMPEGWKEADIYSVANIIYGSPFASKLFNTEKNGKPIIRIRDLKDQHSDVYTPEERDDAYLIQPKDIVVGMDGEFRPYIWGSEPGWLNQRVCVFENKRPKGKAFLYFSIKPLLDVVEKTQVATTVIHIGKKDFDKFQITLPTEEIFDKFDELTDPILDQIVANKLENHRLAELRDTLLPKLMNGEIII